MVKRKILSLVLLFGLFLLGNFGFANTIAPDDVLDFDLFLNLYVQSSTKHLNPAYQQVEVLYQGVDDELLHDTLQRLIFLKLLPNVSTTIDFSHPVKQTTIQGLLDGEGLFDVPYEDTYVNLAWTLDLIKQTKAYQEAPQTILKQISTVLKKEYLYPDTIPDYTKYTSIDAFIADLNDPYTQYFSYEEAKEFKETLYAEKVGIGVYLQMAKDGSIVVTGLLSGGAAQESGIQTGDVVVGIDDISFTKNIEFKKAVQYFSGEVGSQVVVIVKRGNQKYRYLLKRKYINMDTITSKVLSNGLCEINMHFFAVGSIQDFTTALEKLAGKGCQNYVFDLRGNPGGSLEDTHKMLRYFVKKGSPTLILETNKRRKYYYSDANLSDYFDGKKLYFLINEYSASASEVFVGAIKAYHDDAVVVGTTSFGKGVAQNLNESLYGTLLKYTTARWLIGASGHSIDKIGIQPDITILNNPETPIDEVLEWVKNDVRK